MHTVNQQILACYYIWRIAYFHSCLSPPIYVSDVDCTLHSRGDAKSLYFEKRQIL